MPEFGVFTQKEHFTHQKEQNTMDTITKLFTDSGLASTLIYLCLTALVGIAIGKIEVKKIKLGIAGVLFAGLAISHFGANTDPDILHFVKEFGLILFVYAIGIDVGPRFFKTFRNDGLRLNLFAITIVGLGFGVAYLIFILGNGTISSEEITGIMCGAVTNTPGLGAAQQIIGERILLGTLSMAELLSAIVICTSIPTSRQICQQLTVPIITEVLCRSERTGTFFITGIPIIPGTADRDVLKSCRLCRTAVFHR